MVDRFQPPATAVRRLRVLTLNVLSPEHAEGRSRQDVLRKELRRLHPDLVALQEVTRTEDYDQVLDLLGPGHAVIDHPNPSPEGVGAALASRWPLRDPRRLDLRLTPRAVDLPWAAVLVAQVRAPAPLGPLLVVHLKPSWQHGREYEREQQAVAAARFIAAPDSASIRFWTGRKSLDGTSTAYRDCWESVHGSDPGLTFEPHNPLSAIDEPHLDRGRRIDYLLVRCGDHGPSLHIADCQRVLDQPVGGVMASDHYGVIADLKLHQPTEVRPQP